MASSIIVLALALLAGCASSTRSTTPAGTDDHARIAVRLDSLVALSEGDYIHVQVGRCLGSCEATVSIFRRSPARFYIYEAEAWRYHEVERDQILYRLRRPVSLETAMNLIENIEGAGLHRLEGDTTREVENAAYLWVRGRIGEREVRIDGAYTGGAKYWKGDQSLDLWKIYSMVRGALLEPLFNEQR